MMTKMKILRVYTMRIRATNFMSAFPQIDKVGYRLPLRIFKFSFFKPKRFADPIKLNSEVS
jgi:hypothetical protein